MGTYLGYIESSRDVYTLSYIDACFWFLNVSIYPCAKFPAIEAFFGKTSTTGNSQWVGDSPRCEFELCATPFSPRLRNWNRHAKGRNNKFSKGVSHTTTHVCHAVQRALLETWFFPPTKSPLSNVALLNTPKAL
jgi:hypothetical protein